MPVPRRALSSRIRHARHRRYGLADRFIRTLRREPAVEAASVQAGSDLNRRSDRYIPTRPVFRTNAFEVPIACRTIDCRDGVRGPARRRPAGSVPLGRRLVQRFQRRSARRITFRPADAPPLLRRVVCSLQADGPGGLCRSGLSWRARKACHRGQARRGSQPGHRAAVRRRVGPDGPVHHARRSRPRRDERLSFG